MSYFLKILKYIKPYTPYAILNVLFNLLTVVFSLVSLTMVIPFLGILFETEKKIYSASRVSFNAESIKENFYLLISNLIEEKGKLEALLFICLLVLIAFFFRNLFRYLSLYFLSPIRNGVIHDIRKDLHQKVISLPLGFFSEKRKGDISSRMTNDLVEIEWSIMSSLEMIFKDPAHIIIYLATLIVISPELTIFVLILFPITGFLIALIGKSLKKSSQKGQDQMGKLLSIIDENISNLQIIKSLNIAKHINKKFNHESNVYKKTMNKLLRKKDLSSPMSEFLSTLVMVIIMWFGGKLVLSGSSTLLAEEFIAYILIFSQIIPPAKSFTTAYYHIQKGSASAKRVYDILDEVNHIQDSKDSISKLKMKNKIEFKNVDFKYESKNILKNISMKIASGEKIALVGKSGSGKSTIADLLSRFYEVQKGEISIDNINIKDIKLLKLRELIGFVSQESILFNDTIINNIRIGKLSANHEEIVDAAKIANAHDFITKTENGYNTKVGDRGVKLSGGQKQRISIARAILKNPPILILDEATSALDTESEKLIQKALFNLMKDRACLVISHRFSIIQDASEILVLDNGEIIERGTHKYLLKENGYYKKMYDLQSFN